jgi:coproporphyrinogen III oxidase-like Fe-S oxidoreductase
MYFDAIDQQKHPYMDSFELTNYDHIQETIMLGLRTSKGIKLSVLKGIDLNMDYFEISNDYIRIKPNKLFISNEIIVELLEKFDND